MKKDYIDDIEIHSHIEHNDPKKKIEEKKEIEKDLKTVKTVKEKK